MANETFVEPEDAAETWADVRMTDPDEGEWDVDFVVVDGRVDYVDLRIRPELVAAFVECLVGDIDGETAGEILTEVAERRNLDLPARTDAE